MLSKIFSSKSLIAVFLFSGVVVLSHCGQKNDSALKPQTAQQAQAVQQASIPESGQPSTTATSGAVPATPATTVNPDKSLATTPQSNVADSTQTVPPGLYEGSSSDENSPVISSGELARIIKSTTHYPDAEVANLLQEFKAQVAVKQDLPVMGAITARGFNGAFCVDSDHWTPNITFKDSKNNLITLNNLYDMYFQNGGLKIEFCYKWIIMFITGSQPDAHNLDGAVYGRGLGMSLFSPSLFLFPMEFSWLPGSNRPGNLWVISPKIGISVNPIFAFPVMFPKVTFRRKISST